MQSLEQIDSLILIFLKSNAQNHLISMLTLTNGTES